jgi:hypothetical protein
VLHEEWEHSQVHYIRRRGGIEHLRSSDINIQTWLTSGHHLWGRRDRDGNRPRDGFAGHWRDDRVPWGLWITLDLSSIALGAERSRSPAAVYLFLSKTTSIKRGLHRLLGYSSAMLALAMDIGRQSVWHPIVYWNVHSVLWEVTWCVILYFTVLAEVLA